MTVALPTAQNHGEVFTRRWVVDVLLDLTGYAADRDLSEMHLLEPSCGSGAFLGPAVERLIASARLHGRDLGSLGDAVRAYDLQPGHVRVARDLCARLLVDAGVAPGVAVRLTETWVRRADFLLAKVVERPADVVIGNPPYIRYDDLPEDIAAEYRRTWPTMRGRGDIYRGASGIRHW
jgi:adenine-specific DNA-methyltransferase